MRLSVNLLFILITLLPLVLTEAEVKNKQPIKKRKGLKLLKNEEESKTAQQSYESEEDGHVFKRGNKYKDLSEEDSDEEIEEKLGKKGLLWNRNFKKHKFNSYDEYDKSTGRFKNKITKNSLEKSEEKKKLLNKEPDKEGPKKYLKSKNEKSSKEIKAKEKMKKDKGSNEETDLSKSQNFQKRELRPLEKVRTRSAAVKRSDGSRRKITEKHQSNKRSSEESEERDSEETEETDEETDEENDESSNNSDTELQCDSSEENCDLKV